jgi:hypothetical protein
MNEAYESPELIVLGSVSELTAGFSSGGPDGEGSFSL